MHQEQRSTEVARQQVSDLLLLSPTLSHLFSLIAAATALLDLLSTIMACSKFRLCNRVGKFLEGVKNSLVQQAVQ